MTPPLSSLPRRAITPASSAMDASRPERPLAEAAAWRVWHWHALASSTRGHRGAMCGGGCGARVSHAKVRAPAPARSSSHPTPPNPTPPNPLHHCNRRTWTLLEPRSARCFVPRALSHSASDAKSVTDEATLGCTCEST
eukprot:1848538-Rhodomonas_salina.2